MKITIEGMGCEHCVKAVTAALSGIDGVSNVRVTLGQAVLEAAGVSHDALKAAIEDAGYDVVSITE